MNKPAKLRGETIALISDLINDGYITKDDAELFIRLPPSMQHSNPKPTAKNANAANNYHAGNAGSPPRHLTASDPTRTIHHTHLEHNHRGISSRRS